MKKIILISVSCSCRGQMWIWQGLSSFILIIARRRAYWIFLTNYRAWGRSSRFRIHFGFRIWIKRVGLGDTGMSCARFRQCSEGYRLKKPRIPVNCDLQFFYLTKQHKAHIASKHKKRKWSTIITDLDSDAKLDIGYQNNHRNYKKEYKERKNYKVEYNTKWNSRRSKAKKKKKDKQMGTKRVYQTTPASLFAFL